MATEVIMPKAGMAMERGTVIQWFRNVGDRVEAGEPLLEIETDKVAMEVEAEVSGYLLATLYHEGDEVPVITTIGYIGEEGETPPESGTSGSSGTSESGSSEPSGVTATAQPGSGGVGGTTGTAGDPVAAAAEGPLARRGGTIPATPAARRRAGETETPLEEVSPSGTHGEVRLRDVEAYLAESGTAGGTVPHASSLARKIAEERGIDLAGIPGSGPGGRIVKRDLLEASAAGVAGGGNHSERGVHRTPLRGMRRAIAAKMSESHRTVPPVTLNRPVDVDAFLDLRKQINAALAEGQQRVSVTDMLVKVVALALRDAPYMRTAIDGEELVTTERIDIGIAVALEEGLIVPVLRDADSKPLSAIAAERTDLAERARARSVTPDEVQGATFTITNLGMLGITSFTPIVNTPESGILGVNATEERLYLDEEGAVRRKRVMTLSLTIDHRIVDGAQGAIFLQSLAELIENPIRIFV